MKLSEIEIKPLIDKNFIYHLQVLDWGEYFHIIERGGLAICSAYIFNDNDEALYIEGLSVNECIRKRKMGTILLDMYEILAIEMKRRYILLFVQKGSWVEEWYLRRGFVYHSDYIDMPGHIWMQKQIKD